LENSFNNQVGRDQFRIFLFAQLRTTDVNYLYEASNFKANENLI